MRIAIVNHSCNVKGGIETYLSQLMPALQGQSHEIAFWYEESVNPSHPRITFPKNAPVWSVAELGEERAIDALKGWRPDVVYAHGLHSPELERKIQSIAPSVFFAHAYYGTCISGAKTVRWPVVRVCDKQFSWRCLLHYYPRRCGGLNPVVMLKGHQLQVERLKLLANYRAIAVASEHMANEYRKYGFAGKINVLSIPTALTGESPGAESTPPSSREWRLLFLGRMEFLKGGNVLLDALPTVQRELGTVLNVTFAGDGPLKQRWQTHAGKLAQLNKSLRFNFPGWVSAEDRDSLLRECDLLVVPSLWPEPFGLVGLEVGRYGVPSVAFAVGGIPQWLSDGCNGFLASPDHPKELNLAWAIIRSLQDPDTHRRLRLGAAEQARRFCMQGHLADLLHLFENVTSRDSGMSNVRAKTQKAFSI